ncbi:MAG TPA: nuclear transport factor 2 family protein [Terriglobia bacterium]|nr:nuclear transport factor 2 family protein [Terriglobia bacterium]
MVIPEVVQNFVARINQHDTPGLVELMSPDHVLIDSLENRITRPAVEAGWPAYFAVGPDYWIKVASALAEGDTVALFGSAGGTYIPKGGVLKPENKWEAPAAWLARVRDGRISEWRVYCDNEPIREKMRSAAR